jgi:hypothetical protein
MKLYTLLTGIALAFVQINYAHSSCLEKFKNLLNFPRHIKTNPKSIQDILTNDMMLADQEDVEKLFIKELKSPVSLTPMIEEIETAIIKKHPAINEFICTAIGLGLIGKVSHSDYSVIYKTIQHTYVLEKITLLMRADHQAMDRIANHLFEVRKSLGLDTHFNIFLETKQLFMPAKMISMDIAMSRFSSTRRENVFSSENESKTKIGLQVNIVEAMLTDISAEFFDNAKVGKALASEMPKKVEINGEDRVINYYLEDYWMPLYETWNLAFITGNLTSLEVLYPKLLIPSVINANKNDYIFSRGLSLWLTTNFYLFKIQKGIDRPLRKGRELSELWGKINLKYIP